MCEPGRELDGAFPDAVLMNAVDLAGDFPQSPLTDDDGDAMLVSPLLGYCAAAGFDYALLSVSLQLALLGWYGFGL